MKSSRAHPPQALIVPCLEMGMTRSAHNQSKLKSELRLKDREGQEVGK